MEHSFAEEVKEHFDDYQIAAQTFYNSLPHRG
jgi:hypothetical protein